MPELPEVEIMVRRLGAAAAGAQFESTAVRGVGTLKSFDPPLTALQGQVISGMSRRGKHLVVETSQRGPSGQQPGGGRADEGPQRGPSGQQPGGGRADEGPQRGPSGQQPGGGR